MSRLSSLLSTFVNAVAVQEFIYPGRAGGSFSLVNTGPVLIILKFHDCLQ